MRARCPSSESTASERDAQDCAVRFIICQHWASFRLCGMCTARGAPEMNRLKGKVALIAGGGADGPAKTGEQLSIGNGRATAILCAREGAAVMVLDRSLKLAAETAEAIKAEGGKADACEADVSNEDQCRAAVEATVKSFGALHLLVNNVGIAIGGPLLETTQAQFDTMAAVNVRGHFLMMKSAVPEMKKAGGGAIVNVSSLA